MVLGETVILSDQEKNRYVQSAVAIFSMVVTLKDSTKPPWDGLNAQTEYEGTIAE